mgnify:CR=1 FL=1
MISSDRMLLWPGTQRAPKERRRPIMNRNLLFRAIAVFGIGIGALGFWLYEDRQRHGVEVTFGRHGMSVQER